jgi:hypothetical protein
MENIQNLNIEFKIYLDTISAGLTDDLVRLLKGETIHYLHGTHSDIKAFYFEYEYDYLNIVFWGVDHKGTIATNTQSLPTRKNGNTSDNEEWSALFPEEIWNKVSDVEDHYEDDDFDEIMDEYNEEKYQIFEQWFSDCWKKASEQTSIKMNAYFSIHDTYFRTDLNTMKTINEDEIAQIFE